MDQNEFQHDQGGSLSRPRLNDIVNELRYRHMFFSPNVPKDLDIDFSSVNESNIDQWIEKYRKQRIFRADEFRREHKPLLDEYKIQKKQFPASTAMTKRARYTQELEKFATELGELEGKDYTLNDLLNKLSSEMQRILLGAYCNGAKNKELVEMRNGLLIKKGFSEGLDHERIRQICKRSIKKILGREKMKYMIEYMNPYFQSGSPVGPHYLSELLSENVHGKNYDEYKELLRSKKATREVLQKLFDDILHYEKNFANKKALLMGKISDEYIKKFQKTCGNDDTQVKNIFIRKIVQQVIDHYFCDILYNKKWFWSMIGLLAVHQIEKASHQINRFCEDMIEKIDDYKAYNKEILWAIQNLKIVGHYPDTFSKQIQNSRLSLDYYDNRRDNNPPYWGQHIAFTMDHIQYCIDHKGRLDRENDY